MSSRNAEATVDGAPWQSLLGGRSITAHIARLYTVSAVVLLAIVVGLLYLVEAQRLKWDDAFFLTDKIQQLRMLLRLDAGDSSFLVRDVKAQWAAYAAGEHHRFYSRILDPTGRVLIESQGTEAIPQTGLFPPPADNGEIPRTAERRTAADGQSYLLMSAWGLTGGAKPELRLIQVALDDADEMDAIGRNQFASLLLVLFGVLISARVGVLVARSGMRPLADIARVADQITPSQLHKRLDPERWPLELATLARAFDGMLSRLDDSHTRLAQFSADLAHELRTPVQVLMGQTEVALTQERQAEEYRQILESNLEEYHRLTRMINELLFIARAENPKTEIERSWLDARQELEAVREFHEALAEDCGVTVTCQGQASLHADPLLIRRAVTNLLSNALRHTPRGGRVVLSVEQAGDAGVLISVSDTGCGIRNEDLPRVCERLYCSGRGPARCAEGTGLGLAIVKSIAELHGGTATIESTPGQGTSVVLRLPAPEPARA